MTKWMGWPEASEHGGHMIKRLSDPAVKAEDRFECQDCHTVGDAAVFGVGIRGCPKRPESLNYLTISRFDGVDDMPIGEQLTAARDHWLNFTKRLGMEVSAFNYYNREAYEGVYDLMDFINDDRPYVLRYHVGTKAIEVTGG